MANKNLKKYHVGILYDLKYYVVEVDATDPEAAKDAVRSRIDTAKEYAFTSVQEVPTVKTQKTHSSKKLYVAYGSNLHKGQMAHRCPDATVYGSGVIKNYGLRFYGVASIEPEVGTDCPVGVWEISERDEAYLDRYEGWPRLYRKELIDVVMDNGEVVKAMVYIMNHSGGQSIPTQTYYNTIRTGYYHFKLGVEYLDKVVNEVYEEDGYAIV